MNPGGVRIGLAGRSERRLADVRAGLGAAGSAWPLLVADSADPVSVTALARAARVVVTTVGPYRDRGLALVEACAASVTGAGARRGGPCLDAPIHRVAAVCVPVRTIRAKSRAPDHTPLGIPDA
jgi:hypothetical protein